MNTACADLPCILAINAGSSSLKFALHPLQEKQVLAASLYGQIEGLEPGGQVRLGWCDSVTGASSSSEAADTTALQDQADQPADPFDLALQQLQNLLQLRHGIGQLQAVAHRVVHGGEWYRQAVLIDATVLARLQQLQPLAPLHQPHNIAGILAFGRVFASVPQVACFDTAFHASLPALETLFALPPEMAQQGIRRYGFHGLSYQWISQRLARVSQRAQGRVLMAHLGNGASLCAMLNGSSRATSMGFSALDGLMMGSRCGALDPGVLLHLLAQGWDAARLQDLLYRQSGLLGVSGISADMRRLRQSDAPAAKLALAMFSARVVREAGALIATMGGLDVLSFSAGIGEHDPLLRQQVCQALAFLGVQLDPEQNQRATGDQVQALHAASSQVEIWLVPTDEGRVAAQAASDLLAHR